MPAEPFETVLAGVFADCERELQRQIVKAKARAEALQAEDTSRLAFTLTETIEHAIGPAIEAATDRYDEALGQPVTSSPRWEDSIRSRIGLAVDEGLSQALAIDELAHPWKPLLKAEAPQLRERLLAQAEAGFKVVHRRHGPHRRRAVVRREWTLRVALLVLGVLLGAMLRTLVPF